VDPKFKQNMIDTLVMDEQRKKILKAQTVSFIRTNKLGFNIERKIWSADYVEGKGSGLIFLLHGSPGVGKTYTAGWSSQLPLCQRFHW